MAANFGEQEILSVHHWNDTLFSFTTTRNPGFRFENGQFKMIGLKFEGNQFIVPFTIAWAK